MKLLDEGAPNPRGDALLAELRWIHDIIRGNLAAIAAVVEQITAGAGRAGSRPDPRPGQHQCGLDAARELYALL